MDNEDRDTQALDDAGNSDSSGAEHLRRRSSVIVCGIPLPYHVDHPLHVRSELRAAESKASSSGGVWE
jgi:hypothetical protein